MNFFKKLFSIVFRIYLAIVFVVSLVITYPFFKIIFFFSRRSYYFAFRCMHIYAKVILFFMFMRVRIINSKPVLPEAPFIICANHSSFIDIPCIYSMFDKYFVFTGKKEIEKWPLFRIFYTSGMNIIVDRKDKIKAAKSMRRMMAEIDKGNSLVIFPEGTITKNAPHLGEFKSGAFQLAIQKKIPIVPITFLNNYKRLERKSFFSAKSTPGNCDLIIHDPICTSHLRKIDSELLSKQVKQIIEEPLLSES